jgi:hypothetical protein
MRAFRQPTGRRQVRSVPLEAWPRCVCPAWPDERADLPGSAPAAGPTASVLELNPVRLGRFLPASTRSRRPARRRALDPTRRLGDVLASRTRKRGRTGVPSEDALKGGRSLLRVSSLAASSSWRREALRLITSSSRSVHPKVVSEASACVECPWSSGTDRNC